MPLTLATFNTKDLLAAQDDASRAHLETKLDWLASMLRRIDADVLGLQEVASAELLVRLVERLDGRGGYGEPLVGTADTRGIRNAVLTRLRVLAWKVHAPARLDFPVFQAGDPPPFGDRVPMRRGVVQARLDAGALGELTVLVAHFKSNLRLMQRDAQGNFPPWSESIGARAIAEAELRSLVWRSSEALFVRGLVDELASQSPDARLAVLGDLNDRPGSLVLRIVTGYGPSSLRSCASAVDDARRFTVIFRGRRDQFDHILATPALHERMVGARILNEELRDHGEIAEGEPLPADSDHAPLVASFQ